MIRPLLFLVSLATALPAGADSLVAAATIRAKTVIGPEHLARGGEAVPGALRDPDEALGLEARVAIYAGRPIRAADLGPPAVVERNQIVTLVFHRGGLAIRTEGRALGRAAAGEVVRVLNLASRQTVSGVADPAAIIHVGHAPGHPGSFQ